CARNLYYGSNYEGWWYFDVW
nr:immunoglobulin heavy chain junction region [Mus musculus]